MQAHFALWRVLKSLKENKVLLKFSFFMVKCSHSNEVNSSEWIKAYILYAQALFLNAKYEDAIELLRNLLDLFANIPIDEIKFLSEVNKNNKISLTNVFEYFEWALNFYSKNHVYEKSKAIFNFNFKKKFKKIEIFMVNPLKIPQKPDINNHSIISNNLNKFSGKL